MNKFRATGDKKPLDFEAINTAINAQTATILQRLFPNGRLNGATFRMGSINAEVGSSLAVCLSGPRAGVWRDFATGEKGGDIISLLAASDRCSQSEAARKLGNMTGAN